MIFLDKRAPFDAAPADFAANFEREPFSLSHNLSSLDILNIDSLESLSRSYRAADYFVAGGARTAATAFHSVSHGMLEPHEVIAQLDGGNVRVLLKRPENYDPRFRELLDRLLAAIFARGGDPGRIARVQSSILISSAATITPFHFDPEVSFFFQIEGPKTYHVYSPSTMGETELERFYQRGVVDIAQVDLHGRDPEREYIFELGPGKGLHQPRNAPHWVETQTARSISYVVSYETAAMRAADRTRACNFYLRKFGVKPEPVGRDEKLDTLKSGAMLVAIPLRNAVKRPLRRWTR